jgi:hypothetical protein
MNTYYFVGGPLSGCMDEFRARLGAAGGPPPGWLVYPHASGDGRALHVVHAESRDEVIRHLERFDGIYSRDEIVEVRSLPPRS